jgi:hypothetical protein
MSISDLDSYRAGGAGAAGGPAQVLAQAATAVRELDETMWAAQSDADLVGVVEAGEALRSALAAVQAGAVAEADARCLAKDQLHYGSTGDWLTHLAGLRKGGGKRINDRAHALTGPLATTRRAMAAGRVSPEQADVICEAVDALPSGTPVRRRGETALLTHATSLDASDLARAGRHLVHVVDPEAHERRLERQLDRDERASHLGRTLSIAPDGAGGVRLKGRGSAEDGALLKAALLPLTRPAPSAGDPVCDEAGRPTTDPTDHGARLWDALVQTAHHALSTTALPDDHGAPARLTVTTTLTALRQGLPADEPAQRHSKDHHPADHDRAEGDPAGSHPSEREAGIGLTGDGTELSAATIRRMACDAEIIPAVLGSRGEVLDVGRARRLVTPAIWVALVLRDRHCAFPSCTRPPVMCQAHHITPWATGGLTKLSNLVLLCGHHHRVVHHTPWEVRLSPINHSPEFRAPPKPDVEQQPWIRHRPRQT